LLRAALQVDKISVRENTVEMYCYLLPRDNFIGAENSVPTGPPHHHRRLERTALLRKECSTLLCRLTRLFARENTVSIKWYPQPRNISLGAESSVPTGPQHHHRRLVLYLFAQKGMLCVAIGKLFEDNGYVDSSTVEGSKLEAPRNEGACSPGITGHVWRLFGIFEVLCNASGPTAVPPETRGFLCGLQVPS